MDTKFHNILEKIAMIGGGVLLVRVGGLLIQIGLFLLIARNFSIESVGIYAVINSFWMIVRHLGALGLDQASMKYVPLFTELGSYKKVGGFHKATFFLVLSVGLTVSLAVFCLGMLGASKWVPAFDGRWGYVAAPIIAYSLIGLLVGKLRAVGKPFWAQFPESLMLPVASFLGVSVVVLGEEPNLDGVLIAQAGASWLILATYFIVSKEENGEDDSKLTFDEFVEIWRMSFNTLLSQAATALTLLSPVFLVSLFIGNAAAAVFEAASRFGRLPSLITWAMGVTLSPLISIEYKQKNSENLQGLLTLGSWLATISASLVFLLFLGAGEFFLQVALGDGYGAAFWPMLIIVASVGVNAMFGLISNLYTMTGYESRTLWFSIGGLVTVLIGIPMLTVEGGAIGAAMVIFMAALVRDGGMALMLKKYLGLRPGLGGVAGARLFFGQLKGLQDKIVARSNKG